MGEPSADSEPLPYESGSSSALPEARRICAKCGGTMQSGFIPDRSHGAVHVQHWIDGSPEKSFWQVTRTRGKPTFLVETFRCERCGFLESYARQPK